MWHATKLPLSQRIRPTRASVPLPFMSYLFCWNKRPLPRVPFRFEPPDLLFPHPPATARLLGRCHVIGASILVTVSCCMYQAKAITGHKAQGMTLASIVVSGTSYTNKAGRVCSRIRSPGWLYVALSRVCKASDITLDMPCFPTDKLAKRRTDIDAEMARLQTLHVRTADRLARARQPPQQPAAPVSP